MLAIDVISVQPQMFSGFLTESMVARAVKKGAARRAKLYNERTFCSHKAVRKIVKK